LLENSEDSSQSSLSMTGRYIQISNAIIYEFDAAIGVK